MWDSTYDHATHAHTIQFNPIWGVSVGQVLSEIVIWIHIKARRFKETVAQSFDAWNVQVEFIYDFMTW